MKRTLRTRLPLFVAGTAIALTSFGAVAQGASATPVPARGQSWVVLPSAVNKWSAVPLAGHSFLGGLYRLPGTGTGPVMPPLF